MYLASSAALATFKPASLSPVIPSPNEIPVNCGLNFLRTSSREQKKISEFSVCAPQMGILTQKDKLV